MNIFEELDQKKKEDRAFFEELENVFILFEYQNWERAVVSFPRSWLFQIQQEGYYVDFKDKSAINETIGKALIIKLLNEGFISKEDELRNWMEISFDMFQAASKRERLPNPQWMEE